MVLKFTQDGKFLMQIGKPGQSKGSNDVENLRIPAKTFVDPKTNELYVADGYGNHRVIVFDADTGSTSGIGAPMDMPDDTITAAIIRTMRRRSSSAIRCTARNYGRQPALRLRPRERPDPSLQTGWHFHQREVHQKRTLGSGSVWDIAFSKDPQQKYIYLADGENDRVHILDRDRSRSDHFGEGGRQPGEFYGVHSIATDSKGNIYTTETYRGQRVQNSYTKGSVRLRKQIRASRRPKGK